MFHLASLDPTASHRTAENTKTYMLDGWNGWLAWIYLRTLLPLEHLAVLKKLWVVRKQSDFFGAQDLFDFRLFTCRTSLEKCFRSPEPRGLETATVVPI